MTVELVAELVQVHVAVNLVAELVEVHGAVAVQVVKKVVHTVKGASEVVELIVKLEQVLEAAAVQTEEKDHHAAGVKSTKTRASEHPPATCELLLGVARPPQQRTSQHLYRAPALPTCRHKPRRAPWPCEHYIRDGCNGESVLWALAAYAFGPKCLEGSGRKSAI